MGEATDRRVRLAKVSKQDLTSAADPLEPLGSRRDEEGVDAGRAPTQTKRLRQIDKVECPGAEALEMMLPLVVSAVGLLSRLVSDLLRVLEQQLHAHGLGAFFEFDPQLCDVEMELPSQSLDRARTLGVVPAKSSENAFPSL